MDINLKYKQYFLDNGLRVILHQDKATPIASVNLWYHVGSWNEKPGKTGFAHLFEHMMFQGSTHVPDNMHFQLLQSIGASLNGSTSFNRTNYYETVPSHYLEMALWLEADRMGYLLSAMNQEKLDNQRDVVKNERRQTVDNVPYGTWLEKLLELTFPVDNSYHWPIIGYMDDLDTASLEDIRHFFKTYYSPANASLCIAGDFDEKTVLTWIKKYFGPIKGGMTIPPVKMDISMLEQKERRLVVEDTVQLPRIYLSYPITGYGTKDWYVGDLLADLISSGKSARLHKALVYEQQVAQEIYAFVFATEGIAQLIFMATAMQGVDEKQLESALFEEINTLVKKGISDFELEKVKNQIEAYKIRELQSVTHIADSFNQAATYFGDPNYLNKEIDMYLDISKDDITRFIHDYLDGPGRTILTYIPKHE